ncbi:MAG TPA: hypothetical protein VGW78_06730 [Candidatus Babeliales bacterium]|jgi:hypothetical protein|nr:hypothetical protein [Candidatus Babeliales bacterium]
MVVYVWTVVALYSFYVHASPFDTITSWFGKYPYEEVIYKEYQCKPNHFYSLIIDQTLNGSVSVIGWDQPLIAITATKKVSKEEDMPILALSMQQENEKVAITTGYNKGTKKPQKACAFDLNIFVPEKTKVTIDSINNVEVHDVLGSVEITTEQGSITAGNINNTLTTHIDMQGTTTLENIKGSINATSIAGDIIVINSYAGVTAHTDYGKVKLLCAHTPSASSIDLKTASHGVIELLLPEDIQATITGTTNRGKIVSSVPITLKPRTTILNAKTYKRMPKELHGIIGQKGNAEIKLSSARGIRIAQNQTA